MIKQLIFIVITIIVFYNCKKSDTDNSCHFDGKNYITYDSFRIDSCNGSYLVYDRISDKFFYSFIIGTDTLEWYDDVDKYKTTGSYIRLIIQADTFFTYDNIIGEYKIENNDLNEIYIETKNKITKQPIIEGIVRLSKPCINNLTKLDFIGKTSDSKQIKVESYIQSIKYAYKLSRKVKGSLNYKDTIFELSLGNRDDQFSKFTRLTFDDYKRSERFELLIDILVKNTNISGIYKGKYLNQPSKFFGYIALYDYYKKIYEISDDFEEGIFIIDQKDTMYNISFDFVMRDSNRMKGNWNGIIDK